MTHRLRALRKRREDIHKRIELCKKNKEHATRTVQKIAAKYSTGKISHSKYHEIIEKAFGSKPPEKWLEYYDININDYITQLEWCNKEIKKELAKASTFKLLFFIAGLFIIALVITGIYLLQPIITGFSTEDIPKDTEKASDKEAPPPTPQETAKPEPAKEKQPPQEQAPPSEEENPQEQNETETPIKEEQNETEKKASPEETPTEPLPPTEPPEKNLTSSETPTLTQQIPDKEITKNTELIIELSQYFSNADEFSILQVQNLSTTILGKTIKITPDTNFIGERTIRIIASNSEGKIESNPFTIKISETTNSPSLIKQIPDIEIKQNSQAEIKLSEYFSNADGFFVLQIKNISTTTFDHTILLKPDAGFTGSQTTQIIALNEFGTTESNQFKITIVSSKEKPEKNETEIPLNITSEMNISAEINISTLKYKAVINRPLKWLKIVEAVSVEDIENLSIEIPKSSNNISIRTGAEIEESIKEAEDYEQLIENTDKENLLKGTITGNVARDLNSGKGILTRFWNFLRKITITGKVIQEEEITEKITETPDKKEINIGEIASQIPTNKIAVEYYTEGATAIEQNLSNGKRIVVSGPTDLNLKDVLAFTEIPELFTTGQESQIRVYWREQKQFINFAARDLNGNNKFDYVEWLVPHLSNQTFDVILITEAEHLNENREFISDIFEQVKALDDIWSETIPSEHYVRVTFEQNLTSQKDITIYPRIISGAPRIEIYEVDENTKIAEFSNIQSNQYNKVFLTNLQGSQDIFDLKILEGSVEFDHIIDPTQLFYEDWDGTNHFNNWNNLEWTIATDQKVSGTNSTKCATTANCDMNTSVSIDTSTAGEVNVTLSYRDDDLEAGDAIIYWLDSSGNWDSMGDFDAAVEDAWEISSNSSTESQYRHSAFSIRLFGDPETNENVWIDNINVSTSPDTTGPGVTINFPTNATYSTGDLPLNFSVSTTENATVEFTLDAGVNNYSMSGNEVELFGREFNRSNGSIADASYTFKVYANDTLGNINDSEQITFSVETPPPTIDFVSPTPNNGSSQSSSSIFVNLSTSDSRNHYSFIDFNNDVVLWMRFDDRDTNGDPTDLSSYSNNGSLKNSALINNTGYWGDSAFFGIADTDQHVVINDSNSLDLNNEMGFSVWIAPDFINTDGNNHTIIDKSFPGNVDAFRILFSATEDDFGIIFYNTSTTQISCYTQTLSWNALNWHHLAGTYNGTDVAIFWDGSLNNPCAYTGDISTNINNVTIGERGDLASVMGWEGHIDEVILFNRSLTATEISALYNASATQYERNFTGLATGTHKFTGYAVDNLGNKNNTEQRQVTIDTTNPLLTIASPTNTTYSTSSIEFNITLNEEGDAAWFTLDSGVTNFTMTEFNITYFNYTNSSVLDGGYTAKFYANDTAGNLNDTESVTFVVSTTANNAPIIISVDNSTFSPATLRDGPSNTNLTFNFSVFDQDGASNLDSSTAMANFTRGVGATRSNSTCAQIESSGNYANYTCTIDMWWFDSEGPWNITAFIKDSAGEPSTNDTTTLIVNSLTGFNLGPATVTFATIAAGATNTTATTNPLLNNTGNTAISDGNIQINATHLVGETTTSEKIYSGNMSAGATTGSNAECNFPATANQMNITSGSVYTAISGATLSTGNYTLNDGTAQENLYICITLTGGELSQQAYSTLQEGAWTIQIALAAFAVAGEALRRKRKKKKSEGITEKNILDVLEKKLKAKYGLGLKEIITESQTLPQKQKQIPIQIFKNKLAPAEALTKYLKENLSMNFVKISSIINRDQRTIALNYRNALNKKKEKITIEEKTPLSVGLSIFSNRKLSILESLVHHLREKGLKNLEIAELLGKDQRNIFTIYSRAVKKIGNRKDNI